MIQIESKKALVTSSDVLKLINYLEESSLLCTHMNFKDDRKYLIELQKKYCKLYNRLKKQENSLLE